MNTDGMDLPFISLILKLVGLLLLGFGLLIGAIADDWRWTKQQREFAEHINRMDALLNREPTFQLTNPQFYNNEGKR